MINLVTTRDQKYWPKEGENILMGPWCLPKEAVFDVEALCNKVPAHFTDDQLKDATEQVEHYYEELLSVMIDSLNEVHGVTYSKRYWRIILGPYLFYFTNAIYDRYIRLTKIREIYPDINCPILGEKSFTDIHDTHDFVIRSKKEDLYNLQLLTRIFKSKNKEGLSVYNVKCCDEIPRQSSLAIKQKHNLLSQIRRDIYKKINSVISQKSEILLYKSYHPDMLLAKLMLSSKGKISHIENCETTTITQKKSHILREKLKDNIQNKLASTDAFFNILMQVVVDELPMIFLEGYKKLESESIHYFKQYSPKQIGSAIGWYFDEHFKMWSAVQSENGVKLIGIQHGGNYGMLESHFGTTHESTITDYYCTWGWNNNLNKCIPNFSPFIKYKSKDCKQTKGVLFISTGHWLYGLEFPFLPEYSREYVKQQKVFFSNCNEEFLINIKFRPYLDDSVWEAKKSLEKSFPLLNFDDTTKPFTESLNDCKLFVCDHLSTTYLQSLSINKPMILFWDPKITVVSKHAKPFFDELRKVKILHDSPENAAKWMQEVYDNVENWWFSNECQAVVKKFCAQYVKTSQNPVRDWYKILKNVNKCGK